MTPGKFVKPFWALAAALTMIAAPAHLIRQAAAQPGGLADVPPPEVNGITIYEPSTSYWIELDISRGGSDPVRVKFQQPTRTRDRRDLRAQWSLLTDVADEHYVANGFKPLPEDFVLKPATSARGFALPGNEPTGRQICGGFALAPALGMQYRISTNDVLRVVSAHGILTGAARAEPGDVVLFHTGVDADKNPAGPCHYALLDVDAAGQRIIYTKNNWERAYVGKLDAFQTSNASKQTATTLAFRVGSHDMQVSYYRMPWDQLEIKRVGKLHADERPATDRTVPMRIQVVNRDTYELLPGAKVWLTFGGRQDRLVELTADAEGCVNLKTLPGDGGEYDVRAQTADTQIGVTRARARVGAASNVIVGLRTRGADAEVLKRYDVVSRQREDAVVDRWTLQSSGVKPDTHNYQAALERERVATEELDEMGESYEHLSGEFMELIIASAGRLEARLKQFLPPEAR